MINLLQIDGISDWNSVAGKLGGGWISDILSSISWVLWVGLILVGAVGSIYAIFIGIKMARAESAEQREEAKKHLINVIVSIVVVIALILFFNSLLPVILNAFDIFDGIVESGTAGSALSLLLRK